LRQLGQLRLVSFFGENKYHQVLRVLAGVEAGRIAPRDSYSLELAGFIAPNKQLRVEYRALLRSWILDPELDVVERLPTAYMRVLLGWDGVLPKDEMAEQEMVIVSALNSMILPLDESKLLKSLLAEFKRLGLDGVYGFLRTQILKEWAEQASDLVRDQDVLGEYFNPEDTWSAEETLERFLESSLSETGVKLASDELQELCENVSIESIINHNIEVASREDWQAESWREQRNAEQEDLAAVDDLFERNGR
jgi:hypothetical protein